TPPSFWPQSGMMFIDRSLRMSLAPSERNVLWQTKYLAPPERNGFWRTGSINISSLRDWRSRHESFPASEYLLEVTRNLRVNPSSHRHRDAIPDHSIGIVVAARESECVRHSLQPGVFADRIGP